jgi:hypothetical protein
VLNMASPGAVGAPPGPAAQLLDFSKPLDVTVLDATVAVFYGAGSSEEVKRTAPSGPGLPFCSSHNDCIDTCIYDARHITRYSFSSTKECQD